MQENAPSLQFAITFQKIIMLTQPANENSGSAFKFSYGCKIFTFLDSPSCAPHRLGGDCVFAIALLAPTFRQCSTYYRVPLAPVIYYFPRLDWISYLEVTSPLFLVTFLRTIQMAFEKITMSCATCTILQCDYRAFVLHYMPTSKQAKWVCVFGNFNDGIDQGSPYLPQCRMVLISLIGISKPERAGKLSPERDH